VRKTGQTRTATNRELDHQGPSVAAPGKVGGYEALAARRSLATASPEGLQHGVSVARPETDSLQL
jgi:hypothetical protein